jgi:hypothetical protein
MNQKKQYLLLLLFVGLANLVLAQKDSGYYFNDSLYVLNNKSYQLSEVVVRNNLDVPSFIKRMQDDTTFYKAFRNLRILSYTSYNDVRMKDKKGQQNASLSSRTRQTASNGCRSMQTHDEKITGDLLNKKGDYNYYTMQLYASLFFTKGTLCGQNNIVGNKGFELKGKTGEEKRKEQLRMLFFNPGKRIPGLPFIANNVAIFDEDMAALYDFTIDLKDYNGQSCYVFDIRPKANLSTDDAAKIVIEKMITWFDYKNFNIVARHYSLNYSAVVYSFDVDMEVEMTQHNGLTVPKFMRYNGEWGIIFKKKERGVFTATLSDFE